MSKRNYNIVISAAFLIVTGSVLLLNNLELLPFKIPTALFRWESLLVLLGIYQLLKASIISGLIMIATGAFLMLPDLTGVPVQQLINWWPALIIVAGIGVLLTAFVKREPRKKKEETVKDGELNNTVVFGGTNRKFRAYDFTGGTLEAIFGGMEIDISECYLSKEKNVLDISVVFGGIELYVSKEWNLNIEVVPVLGGVEDNDRKDFVDPAATLTIRGAVVFGGLEIHRV